MTKKREFKFTALKICVLAPLLVVSSADASTSIMPHQESQLQGAQVAVPFDGVWEGKIAFDKEGFLTDTGAPRDGVDFRIEIHGAVVRVFTKDGGLFSEAKAGAFHIAPVGTNAVVFATDSQPGAWMETWIFALTQRDDHTLTVEYSRLVNNLGLLRDDPQKNFGTRGAGEFTRVAQ